MAFALSWVNGEEVLAEVVGHDNVLTKNLVKLLIVLVVVLEGDFLEHCLDDLLLFVLLKHISWILY